MVHGGISGPHTGGDPPQAEQEGEDHVADHRLPDLQVLATLAPGDGGLEQHGHLVRPGQLDVLLPPALHHQGDVESEEEGQVHRMVSLEPDDHLRFVWYKGYVPC